MTEEGLFIGLKAAFLAIIFLVFFAGVSATVVDIRFDTGLFVGICIILIGGGCVLVPHALGNPRKFIFVFSFFFYAAMMLVMQGALGAHQPDNPKSPMEGYYLNLFVAPLIASTLLGGIMGKILKVR